MGALGIDDIELIKTELDLPIGVHEIKEADNNEIKIFPNPATTGITIIFSKMINVGKIEMFNLLGKNIFNQKITNSSQMKLDTRIFSPGIYFVKIIEGDKYYCKKIILE